MHRRLSSAALIAFLVAAQAPAFARTAQLFSTAYVQASVPRNAIGRDAGVDVGLGTYVRVSASGRFTTRAGMCGTTGVGPNGCAGTAQAASAGTLVAAFVDDGGRMVGTWTPVGTYVNLPVPAGAKRLVLRVNGMSGREYGAYRVIADVVSNAAPAQLGSGASGNGSAVHIGANGGSGTATTSAIRIGSPNSVAASVARTGRASTLASAGNGTSPGVLPTGGTTSRSDVQYALRRLGFSDTPAAISSVMATGVPAWVAAQIAAPSPDNDTSIVQGTGGNVEAMPVLTGNATTDGNYGANIEDRLMQWQVNTRWQLREKLTLHWLEHFAVSQATVNQPGDMEHYIATVRADALGNYAKLLADVSKEPAMMIWLNNANNAYSTKTLPNENFGREIMQLYSIGLNTLNADGTVVQDPSNPGQALPTYSEADVKTMALALTGFQLKTQTAIGTYPAYVDQIVFTPSAHAPATNGGFTVMGKLIADGKTCPWTYTTYQTAGLNSACVVDNAALSLASNSTTWVYESIEMLQRLVTETPSPAMISRISTVWGATVNDPNQIAKVISAIASDPEFYGGKYGMIKEPIEFEVDAIRAFSGATTNPITGSVPRPLSSAISDTARMAQEIWDPPSVFAFYYPGQKSAIVNNAQLLATWSSASNLAGSARTVACTTCSIYLDFTSFAAAKATTDLAGYLLDALVDGGTPQLNALVKNFLNNNPANVQGALWIILSSPEYGVN